MIIESKTTKLKRLFPNKHVHIDSVYDYSGSIFGERLVHIEYFGNILCATKEIAEIIESEFPNHNIYY